MKRTALVTLFILICFGLTAQDEKANQFKPSKNNFSVEVGFKPFNADSPIAIDGFRGRFFLNDKIAIRTGVNFGYTKKYDETPEKYNSGIYYNTSDERSTVLGFTTGVEYHFLDSRRFSPYFGIIAGYENKTSKSIYNNVNTNNYPSTVTIDKTEITNAWYETYLIQYSGGYYDIVSQLTERGYHKISAVVVLGADFYILKNIYMGIEIGAGYNAYFYKEALVNLNGSVDEKYPHANTNTIGLNVNNAIRLGFWF